MQEGLHLPIVWADNEQRSVEWFENLHNSHTFNIETGHTQFRGQRYCPNTNPLSKEDWLEERRREAAQKRVSASQVGSLM